MSRNLPRERHFSELNTSVSLVVFLLALTYTCFAGKLLEPIFGKWASPFFSFGLALLPLLVAIFFRLDIKNIFRCNRMGLGQIAGGIVLSAGLLIFVLLASGFIAVFFPGVPVSGKNIGTNVLDQNIFRVVLSIAVMPAISEEFLFRGFILSGFALAFPKRKSIILCALLFALLHLEPLQVPFAFLVGIGLSWVALETGSIWIPILMHAFHNLALLLIARGIASLVFVFPRASDFTKLSEIVLAGVSVLVAALVSFILIRLGISLVSRTSRVPPATEISEE